MHIARYLNKIFILYIQNTTAISTIRKKISLKNIIIIFKIKVGEDDVYSTTYFYGNINVFVLCCCN